MFSPSSDANVNIYHLHAEGQSVNFNNLKQNSQHWERESMTVMSEDAAETSTALEFDAALDALSELMGVTGCVCAVSRR